MGVGTPKIGIFGNFWITVGTKPGVPEPSTLSQIEACHSSFRLQKSKFFSHKFHFGRIQRHPKHSVMKYMQSLYGHQRTNPGWIGVN